MSWQFFSQPVYAEVWHTYSPDKRELRIAYLLGFELGDARSASAPGHYKHLIRYMGHTGDLYELRDLHSIVREEGL